MGQSKDRLWSALHQAARQRGVSLDRVEEAAVATRTLVALCGEQSTSRQMQFRIGVALLSGNVHIVAPVCPDYTHENGKYTFRGVGGGTSLLAQLQIRFLRNIVQQLTACRVTLIVADHEADDGALCVALGKSQDEFRSLIQESVQATRDAVKNFGWGAEAMTDVIPSLVAEEREEAEAIRTDHALLSRVMTDTICRSNMYAKIGRFTGEEMVERTIRTAAQYRVMGRFAARNNLLVSNHSTVNLSWYREAGAAVLHNPVSVY